MRVSCTKYLYVHLSCWPSVFGNIFSCSRRYPKLRRGWAQFEPCGHRPPRFGRDRCTAAEFPPLPAFAPLNGDCTSSFRAPSTISPVLTLISPERSHRPGSFTRGCTSLVHARDRNYPAAAYKVFFFQIKAIFRSHNWRVCFVSSNYPAPVH